MRFYKFDGDFPYMATIYAENEEEALKIYQEQVCDLDKEDLELIPYIVDVDVIAKELRESALNDINQEWNDVKIHGIGNYLFDILISNKPLVIFIDSTLV